MIVRLSWESSTVAVAGDWVMRVLILDDVTDVPSATTPVFTVTGPDAGVTTVDAIQTTVPGVWRAVYRPVAPGRHTAAVTADDSTEFLEMFALALVAASGMPTVADVDNYIGDNSYTDGQIQQMLDQETMAQRRVCRIPATYPDDLRGALLRRTQRALALRALALAVKETQEGESQIVLPGNDPEVRRLERPWRRLPIG